MDDLAKYERIEEVRISKLVANLLSGASVLLLLALFGGTVFLLPYRTNVLDNRLVFYLALLPTLVIHELLHAGAAIRYGHLEYTDITFGINWKGLMPYCHIKKPIAVRHYRIVGLMPLFITGPVALGLVFLYPNIGSAMLASVTFSLCTGDLMMIAKMRPFHDRNVLVYDHPSEPGFDLYVLRQDGG